MKGIEVETSEYGAMVFLVDTEGIASRVPLMVVMANGAVSLTEEAVPRLTAGSLETIRDCLGALGSPLVLVPPVHLCAECGDDTANQFKIKNFGWLCEGCESEYRTMRQSEYDDANPALEVSHG